MILRRALITESAATTIATGCADRTKPPALAGMDALDPVETTVRMRRHYDGGIALSSLDPIRIRDRRQPRFAILCC